MLWKNENHKKSFAHHGHSINTWLLDCSYYYYLYYKFKHKPVKLRKVEKQIKEKVRKELHVD